LESGRVRKLKPPKPGEPPKEQPKGLSAQTVKHHHTLLHKALKDAVKWQMIQVNPADAVDPPRVAKSEMQTLSSAEVKKLLTACGGSHLLHPHVLAVMMGMRRGEICALRWSDVDLDGRKIHISRFP
jgi:integrase